MSLSGSHYLAVRTRSTLRVDRDLGFALLGLSDQTANAYPLGVGDRLVVYAGKPVSGFVATIEVSGQSFESHARLWAVHENPEETFPIRYPCHPRVVVDDDAAVSFRDLIGRLDYTSKLKNPRLWGMLVIRAIRPFSARDFSLIEQELLRARGLDG